MSSTTGMDDPTNPVGSPKNRNRKNQKLKDRKIRKLLTLEEVFTSEQKFLKYHVLTFPGIEIATELNVIKANKDIKEHLAHGYKISKLSKNSLLIEVSSEEQLQKLNKLTNVAGHPVTVQPHRTMNYTKGTIYSENLGNSTEEEILECLTDQGVIKIERMKRKQGNQLIDTHRYILTFKLNRLPRVVKLADWHHEIVDQYIPRPMRCLKCQRLGHLRKWCRHIEDTCANCCQNEHTSQTCNNASFCQNCKGPHPPASRECPAYLLQAEIIATQTREHITRYEASEIVKDRYVEQGKSFSFVVKQQSATVNPKNGRNPNDENNTPPTNPSVIADNTTVRLQNRYAAIRDTSEIPENTQPAIASKTNPQPAIAPKTNPQPAIAPKTKPQPAIAPKTNPQPAIAPKTNPQPAVASETKPKANDCRSKDSKISGKSKTSTTASDINKVESPRSAIKCPPSNLKEQKTTSRVVDYVSSDDSKEMDCSTSKKKRPLSTSQISINTSKDPPKKINRNEITSKDKGTSKQPNTSCVETYAKPMKPPDKKQRPFIWKS